MREDGKSTVRNLFLITAAAFGVLMIVWPGAFARDRRVDDLVELVETQPARHRKLMAIKQLCDIDSKAARTAVIDLAKSSDPATSLAAISSLSREGLSGGIAALEGLAEDANRGDAVREAAIGARLKLGKDDHQSWQQVKSWFNEATKGKADLRTSSLAQAKALWPREAK